MKQRTFCGHLDWLCQSQLVLSGLFFFLMFECFNCDLLQSGSATTLSLIVIPCVSPVHAWSTELPWSRQKPYDRVPDLVFPPTLCCETVRAFSIPGFIPLSFSVTLLGIGNLVMDKRRADDRDRTHSKALSQHRQR